MRDTGNYPAFFRIFEPDLASNFLETPHLLRQILIWGLPVNI